MLSISDEKINTEAVALEIVRHEIMLELERVLELESKSWDSIELITRLEEYLLRSCYTRLKGQIVANMVSNEDIPDYKVELYIRNFIIEPLVEANFRNVVDVLKLRISEHLIPTFPLTSLVFFQPEDGLGQMKSKEFALRMQKMVCIVNLDENFDCLLRMIACFFNKEETVLASLSPSENEADLNSLHIVSLIIQQNAEVLLILCSQVLNSILNNYRFDIMKTEDELKKLRSDFKSVCQSFILADTRRLGKWSAFQIAAKVNLESKAAWSSVKSMIFDTLATAKEYKVPISYTSRKEFLDHYLLIYREALELNMKTNQKIFHSLELFSSESSEYVKDKIRSLISVNHQSEEITGMSRHIVDNIKIYIEMMLIQDHRYKIYRYWPQISNCNLEDQLNYEKRRALAILMCAANPGTVDPNAYLVHVNRLVRYCQTLEVMDDPVVSDCLIMVGNLDSRELNKKQLTAFKHKAEKLFRMDYDLDLNGISYLVFGLYLMIGGGEVELQHIREAEQSSPQKYIELPTVDFTRRNVVMRVIRSLKNGGYHMLNFQIIHIIETAIESRRFRHNQLMDSYRSKKKVQNKTKQSLLAMQKENMYVFEYNKVIKHYHEIPLLSLTDFLKKEPSKHEHTVDTSFKHKFVSDFKFIGSTLNMTNDSLPIMKVDKEATASRMLNTPMLKPRRLFKSALHTPNWLPKTMKRTEAVSKVIQEEDDIKLISKLQYLRQNTKKFDIIEIAPGVKSRCPILCLSGFMSEDSDKARDWKQVQSTYPFAEVLTINWASFTLRSIISTYYNAAMKISVGSLTDLIVEKITEVIEEHDAGNRAKIIADSLHSLVEEKAQNSPTALKKISNLINETRGTTTNRNYDENNATMNDSNLFTEEKKKSKIGENPQNRGLTYLLSRVDSIWDILNKETLILVDKFNSRPYSDC